MTGPVIVEVAGTTVLGPVFTVDTSVQLTDSLGNQSTYVGIMTGGKWYYPPLKDRDVRAALSAEQFSINTTATEI